LNLFRMTPCRTGLGRCHRPTTSSDAATNACESTPRVALAPKLRTRLPTGAGGEAELAAPRSGQRDVSKRRAYRRWSQMSTRMGVGLKPLHGLLICGQLERTQSTSISASKST
jgi:hypothetical protein